MELESASMRGELGAVGDSLQPQTPSRHEKSLGLLTTKFVTLLQEAKDGVLDLKAVSVEPSESLLFASTCHFEPACWVALSLASLLASLSSLTGQVEPAGDT